MTDIQNKILVTGGAGFIGSNFVLRWIETVGTPVVNLDLLTYAGNPENLAALEDDNRYQLVRADICDPEAVAAALNTHRPRAIVHFAAESHVDRSIVDPGAFIHTNVQGTYTLLEQARRYWIDARRRGKSGFPLSACFHRRGLRDAFSRGSGVFRNHSVRAQQPLRGFEGSVRSPRTRLLPYIQASRCSPPTVRTTTAPSSSLKN